MGVVYAIWNALWWMEGRFAPSLFEALTGLPCPTTGMTRGLLALLGGDWRTSLDYHPLAVPLAALFAGSLAGLAWMRCFRGRWRLPGQILWVWLGLLGVAWIVQLLRWML
jgi:hypothetical protein